jgi:hypothetical protein
MADIKGLQEAQRAMLKLLAAVKPEGQMGRAVYFMATQAHRYAVSVTHRLTGALANSHMIVRQGMAQYLIHISDSATNPHGGKPSEYGPVEHQRGEGHAFYNRTVFDGGPELANRSAAYLLGGLP